MVSLKTDGLMECVPSPRHCILINSHRAYRIEESATTLFDGDIFLHSTRAQRELIAFE